MTDSTDPKETLTHDMKRRSVLKAAAWTAPVVAAASVVPMAAASGEPQKDPNDGWIRALGHDGQLGRGWDVGLNDADLNYIDFPETSTVIITVSGSGTFESSSVTGGELVNQSDNVYTYTVPAGTGQLRVLGDVTGTITVQAKVEVPGFDPFVTATATLVGASA